MQKIAYKKINKKTISRILIPKGRKINNQN
jgi:hypothetical protein